MPQLYLPTIFEDTIKSFGGAENINAKLIQFVQPIEEAEAEILAVANGMHESGRVVFLLGKSGIGKSTFIQSLSWRPHLRFGGFEQIDASSFPLSTSLEDVLESIREIGSAATHRKDIGPAVATLNYLEDLVGISDSRIRAFYRSLNGLLRQFPVLLIWPVTKIEDAKQMVAQAQTLSSALFLKGKEIIHFKGPTIDLFPTITKNTIAVLNEGHTISDFDLTDHDFDESLQQLKRQGEAESTLRNYLQIINERWATGAEQIKEMRAKTPGSTEIWFVFSYPQAESIVEQFARKSIQPEEAWRASHGKLYEYIHNNQKAADWDARRLQFAIGGAFTCRVFYMPTNAMVSILAAFGNGYVEKLKLSKLVPPEWMKKKRALALLSKTPLLRQLKGEQAKLGKRRSGTASPAIEKATAAFEALSRWASGGGPGSDEPLNQAFAGALRSAMGLKEDEVQVEQPHPLLKNVVPDIRIDQQSGKHICIEMSYTNRNVPYVVADYILRKLDRYMKQLEHLLKDTGGSQSGTA